MRMSIPERYVVHLGTIFGILENFYMPIWSLNRMFQAFLLPPLDSPGPFDPRKRPRFSAGRFLDMFHEVFKIYMVVWALQVKMLDRLLATTELSGKNYPG